MDKLGWAFLGLITVVLCVGFYFGVVGGLVYICSLVFRFEFSWMLTLGACSLIILIWLALRKK